MFSLQIVDSDAFLDMPMSAQLLYFHLSMRADDDGFVGNPKKIQRMVGAADDDFKVLLSKRFLLSFESGVVVVKHWKIHNYIQSDRYHETKYVEEKSGLVVKENGAYTECIQESPKLDTEARLGKARLEVEEESSPKEIAKRFFLNAEEQNEEFKQAMDALSEKTSLPLEFVTRESLKFTNHWCEKNGSGKKQKWELEDTFEINRRIAKWLNNAVKWSKNTSNKSRGKEIISS